MSNLNEVMAKMEKTAADLASAIAGISDSTLSRRPDEKNWSPKEIICHLRDTEELYLARFQTILAMDEPKFIPAGVDRWPEERQYLRNDILEALSAFRKRRQETLEFLRGLQPEQWNRVGIHATRGRETMIAWVESMANHDNNHLEQLKRALAGQP
jgi:uncharacterized damage-inducible protein DinB